MATDALDGYPTDVAVGKDSLLLCDTAEMADALNRWIHDDTIPDGAPTVNAARGQRIAAGDLILSRRNDPTVDVRRADDDDVAAASVRNGDRWRVAAIDPHANQVAAERLSDGAGAVFGADYVRERVSHGYATTVHSAQGATADTTHAVLGEKSTRSMLYVAMTRGRDAITAYLYQRTTEADHALSPGRDVHPTMRGTGVEAAACMMSILARDDAPATAHQFGQKSLASTLPELVFGLLDRSRQAK